MAIVKIEEEKTQFFVENQSTPKLALQLLQRLQFDKRSGAFKHFFDTIFAQQSSGNMFTSLV